MERMGSIERDEDAAAGWAIRIDSGALDAAAQAELDAWLDADPRRAGALLRAEAALAYLDRGRALAGGEVAQAADPSPGVIPAEAGTHELGMGGEGSAVECPEAVFMGPGFRRDDSWVRGDSWVRDESGGSGEPPRISRRALLWGGGALGTAMAAGLGGLIFLRAGVETIGTAIGEVRRVPLADGSVATINTASRLAVAMAPERRTVLIEDGEAWFQVAHDRTRPFLVEAGNVRVQAVGTAFSVRLYPTGAAILVTEGAVETWLAGRETARTLIAAGARSFVAEGMAAITAVPAAEEIDRALAWRSGELALNGESLDHAVAEINRYNRRRLVIADPALGREPLVGYFRTNEPENFGRAVAAMLGARVIDEGETLRLDR